MRVYFNFCLNIPRTLGLPLLALLLSVTTARGQRIATDPDGESCRLTPDCKVHKYEFQPDPGQYFLHWVVRGDLKLISPDTQNAVEICSAGYGKGRIRALYYTFLKDDRCREQCPDTIYYQLDYDVFKQFRAPDPIDGPACVRAGQTVTYSVPPILTDWPHRAAGIGTDSYFWSGWPASAVVRFSGDSSALTVELPAGLAGGFTVQVQVGRCTARTPAQLDVRLDQDLAAALAMEFPAAETCAALGLRVATLPGVAYTVALPAGWVFASGSTGALTGDGTAQVVYFTTNGGSGNLLISAVGGCGGPQSTGLAFVITP